MAFYETLYVLTKFLSCKNSHSIASVKGADTVISVSVLHCDASSYLLLSNFMMTEECKRMRIGSTQLS